MRRCKRHLLYAPSPLASYFISPLPCNHIGTSSSCTANIWLTGDTGKRSSDAALNRSLPGPGQRCSCSTADRSSEELVAGATLVLARPQACEGDGEALDVHGCWHSAVANVLCPVVCEGVAQMISKVGKGALASGLGLWAVQKMQPAAAAAAGHRSSRANKHSTAVFLTRLLSARW